MLLSTAHCLLHLLVLTALLVPRYSAVSIGMVPATAYLGSGDLPVLDCTVASYFDSLKAVSPDTAHNFYYSLFNLICILAGQHRL